MKYKENIATKYRSFHWKMHTFVTNNECTYSDLYMNQGVYTSFLLCIWAQYKPKVEAFLIYFNIQHTHLYLAYVEV